MRLFWHREPACISCILSYILPLRRNLLLFVWTHPRPWSLSWSNLTFTWELSVHLVFINSIFILEHILSFKDCIFHHLILLCIEKILTKINKNDDVSLPFMDSVHWLSEKPVFFAVKIKFVRNFCLLSHKSDDDVHGAIRSRFKLWLKPTILKYIL